MKKICFIGLLCLFGTMLNAQKIVKIEYFIDSDPGIGLATPISTSNTDSIVQNLNISVSGKELGLHKLHVRTLNDSGKWSLAQTRLFYIENNINSNSLIKAEYYIDKDLGVGTGTSVNISVSDSSTIVENITISNLQTGIHTINFRFKNELNQWSIVGKRLFVVRDSLPESQINAYEYYIDKDPGVGKATLVPFSALDSTLDNLNINIGNLKAGMHKLYFRYRNNLNQWTNTENRLFFVENDSLLQNNVISRGEYFIDSDPGFQAGIPLSVISADSVQNQLEYLVLPLRIGKHFMGLRYKDTLNRWSHTKVIPFEVKRPVSDFSYTVNPATRLVTFSNTTYGTNYFWDFGDLSNSNLQSPTHTFTKPGIYNVCLAVYGKNFELLADTCKNVAVSDSTYSSFKYVATGNTIKFTNTSSTNINKYYWTYSDGSFDTIANPAHTFPKAGVYNVCLKVVNKARSQTADTCKTVKVGAGGCDVKAAFSYLVYQGDSILLFNQKSNLQGGYFSWNFGDGTTSTAPNPQKQYRKSGFYLVSLTVADSSRQCIDYYSDVVKVGLSECKAAFSYFVNAATKEVTFINNSVGSNLKYYWSFNDGKSSDEANPTHLFKSTGLFNVSLTITNTSGTCSDLAIQSIQLGKVDCNAQISYMVDSTNNKVYFSNKASSTTSNNLWTFGDGTYSTLLNPAHVYSAPGYYSVGLTVFNTIGCIDYSEEVVLIGREGIDCESEFVYNVDNKTVSFFNKSKGDVVRYVWNFGDGSALATTENTTHTYTRDGFFNVCLTVTNKLGTQNITCKRFAVGNNDAANCLADFNFTVDSATRTVSFKPDWIGSFDKFEWDFGDKSLKATVKEPTPHQYSKSGYYLVGCALKNTTSGCKSKVYKVVDLSNDNTQKLKAHFGFDSQNYNFKAGGYPVDFIGTGLGDHAKLRWDFGDGTIDSTSTSPEHVYLVPKSYYVCYTVTDQVTGKTDTYCDSVRTNVLCTSDFEPPVAICKDITLTLDANNSASISPQMINNGSNDNCTLYQLTVLGKTVFNAQDIGDHNVKLVAFDGLGNSDTCLAKVTVQMGTSIDDNLVVDGLLVIPNPFTDKVLVSYTTSKHSQVSINLFDQTGKLVDPIVRTKKLAGVHQFVYATSNLTSGVYIFVINTDYGFEKRQILVKQ